MEKKSLWQGRIARLNYFLGKCFTVLPIIVLSIIWWLLGAMAQESVSSIVINLTALLLVVLLFAAVIWYIYFIVSLDIRRLHDIGWSGWWTLTLFIPYLGLIPGLIILFKKGDEGTNAYGEAPHDDKKFLADIFNK